MNIVLATRFYPPDTGGGGIAAYARYCAQGLLQAGHRVLVISQQASGSKPRQVVEGVDVLRIPADLRSYRWNHIPVVGPKVRFTRDVLYALRLRQAISNVAGVFCPDIIEYADIDAESLFHLRRQFPSVVKLHTPHFILQRYYTRQETPYDARAVMRLEKRAILSASGVSSPSHYLAREVEQEYGLPIHWATYVPNFIDTDEFSPQAENKPREIQPMVLYVGRLEPRKGALVFAQAIPSIAHRFPKTRFVFLGADRANPLGQSQKAELEQYFAEQNVREQVEFFGHAALKVFLQHYRRASVFVMPSLFENSPYTLLEAMACALPCVVSHCSGMQEMIVDGVSGAFFEVGNSEDLAEKVIHLLENPAQAQASGQAARLRVLQEYSLPVGIEKTLEFYRHVLAGKVILKNLPHQ